MERAFAADIPEEMTARQGARAESHKRAGGTAEVIRLPLPQSPRGNPTVAEEDHRGSAVPDALERWIFSGPAAALILTAVGALLGLLLRKYLPTQSIFDLM